MLEARKCLLGSKHPEVAETLAGLYRMNDRYEEVEPQYKRAIGVLEVALGPDHPELATALQEYSELLRLTGRDDECRELEQRADAIWSKADRL